MYSESNERNANGFNMNIYRFYNHLGKKSPSAKYLSDVNFCMKEKFH